MRRLTLHILLLQLLTLLLSGCPTEDSQTNARGVESNKNYTQNNASEPVGNELPGRMVKSGKMRADDPQVEEDVLQQIIQTTNQTAISTIAMAETSTSFVSSPVGIAQSLGIAYAGAQGTTKSTISSHFIAMGDSFSLHQALNRLTLNVQDTQVATVSMEHGIWLPSSISLLPTYLDTLAVHYGLSVNLLNSQDESIEAANQWLQNQDAALDQDPITRQTNKEGFLLTPTLKLNAAWGIQFDPALTSAQPFQGTTTQQEIPFMTNHGTLRGFVDDDIQMVELPMEDPNLLMVLISPKASDWSSWQTALTMAQIQTLRDRMDTMDFAQLSIPKINTTATIEHKPFLSELGLASVFNPKSSNYAGMDGQGKLHLGNIVQHTRVTWDERGLDAQDDTLIVTTPDAPNAPNQQVVFDRPFLYLLMDTRHDVIILAGTFTNTPMPTDP